MESNNDIISELNLPIIPISTTEDPNLKPWTMDHKLLLVAVVDTVSKDQTPNTPNEWSEISRRLELCKRSEPFRGTEWFSPNECEGQYKDLFNKLDCLILCEDKLKSFRHSCPAKRELLLRTLASARKSSAEKREEELQTQLQVLAERIAAIESGDLDDKLSEISDAEGSDSEMDEHEEFFALNENDNFVEQINTSIFLDQIFGPSLIPEVDLTSPTRGVTGENANNKLVVSTNVSQPVVSDKPISPVLTNMVRSAIAGATEDDKSKSSSPTSAPTLSRLLEMPVRDRGQPLPPIQSLFDPASSPVESNIDANNLCESDHTNLSASPFKNISPSKLAAVGTTNSLSPEKTFVSPVSQNSSKRHNSGHLPTLTLLMPKVNNQPQPLPQPNLKVLEEIEIANDFVMSSGLIQDGTTEPDSNESSKEIPIAVAEEQICIEQVASTASETIVYSSEPTSITNQATNENLKNGGEVDKSVLPLPDTLTVLETTNPSLLNESVPENKKMIEKEELVVAPETKTPKNDEDDGKRVTRARNKVSISPRVRSISTGKKQVTGAEQDASSETDRPLRATRSRVAVATKNAASLNTSVIESLPTVPLDSYPSCSSSSTTNSTILEDDKDQKVQPQPIPKPNLKVPDEMENGFITSIVIQDDTTEPDTNESSKEISVAVAEEQICTEQVASTASETIVYSSEPTSITNQATNENLKNVGEVDKSVLPLPDTPTVLETTNPSLLNESVPENKKMIEKEELVVAPETKTPKNDEDDGKRVTRARNKVSISPRVRSFSTGKKQVTGAEQDASSETDRPLRATRSRVAVATKNAASLNTSVIESLPTVPLDSYPSSPSSSTTNSTILEDDKDHKAFRKSIMLVWNQIAAHKSASVFMKPISEDVIPGYSKKVKRSMDLTTMKKNIDTGMTRTWDAFKRDLYMMFLNAHMFNPVNHSVAIAAREMELDTRAICEDYAQTQKLLKSSSDVPPLAEVLDIKEKKEESDAEPEAVEEPKPKAKPGRKRRDPSISVAEEVVEAKRRTLRTSTTAATISSWQGVRKGK